MQKSLIHTAIALGLGVSFQAWAVDCTSLPSWTNDGVYNSGEKVEHLDNAYKANWWVTAKSPSDYSGQWQEWTLLGACDTSTGNIPPTVSVTSPLDNSRFTENEKITLTALASDDDGTVIDVEFLLNGVSLGVSSNAPYQLDWTTVVGQHTISAVVTDNEGATTTSAVSVVVTSLTNNLPPEVTLTNPTGTSQIKDGDQVLLTANAADTDGLVTSVDFYVDDKLAGSDTSEPYSIAWVATLGDHSFKAKATDDDNASTFTQTVTVAVSGGTTGGGCAGVPAYQAGANYQVGDIVQNVNFKYECKVAGWCSSDSAWAYEPNTGLYWSDAWTELGICAIGPTVTFTTPADNAVVLAGETVNLAVDATDADGSVASVEFFAAGASLGVDTAAPFSQSWLALGNGEVNLKAVATDNEGNQGNAGVLVSVSDQPVVATLVSPTSGTGIGLGKSVELAADAASLSSTIKQVEFLVNGSVVAVDTTVPYATNWTPGAIGSYTVSALATDNAGNTAATSAATVKVFEQSIVKHKLIGYWHNFVNGAGCPLKLSEMSTAWDVIDIAFAENDRSSNGTVHFTPFSGDIRSDCPALDPQVFKQDMAALQAQGKVFVLSLGGAEGTITLNNDADEAAFVSSLTAIMKEWGFDGLDIDLESGSNMIHGSQIQARLPGALKQIEANIGGDMYVTMAPEHPYVQGAVVAYTGIWGAYIPLIDGLRDTLDLVHVQLYNNGGLPNPYSPTALPEGSVDMMVAQSKMLIEGFELANGEMFLPLRDDQVAIGLPSGPSSANSGQAPTQNILDALDCMIKGTSCGSIVPAHNYPNFGGVMTWSINWDKHDGYNFSGPVGDKLQAMNAQ